MFFCMESWPGLEAFSEQGLLLEDVKMSQMLHLGWAEMRCGRKMA